MNAATRNFGCSLWSYELIMFFLASDLLGFKPLVSHSERGSVSRKELPRRSHHELFLEHAANLIWPALLLTRSAEVAEHCLIQAIDETTDRLPLEENYLYAVARRCVIKAALGTMASEIEKHAGSESRDESACEEPSRQEEQKNLAGIDPRGRSLALALWRMNPLRRAVVILLYLERFHRQDVALLLGVSRSVVELVGRRGLVELVRRMHAEAERPPIQTPTSR